MAVLGEVQREVEFGNELGLNGPRFVLLDPAHSRVVRHPLTQHGFAGLAEGHLLTAAHAAQLKSEKAAEGEP